MLVAENNAIGAIDGAFSSGSTTLKLQSMTGMPVLNNVDEFCILTLIRASDNGIEYVKCTAQDVPARTYTVTRGQEDSVPLDFIDSDEARNLWTKGQIALVQNEADVTAIRNDGSVAMEANLDMNAYTLDNLPDALNPQEPATLNQVEGLVDNITAVNSVLLATIPLTADGVDVAHDVAWDSYDELFVEVKGATLTGAGGTSGNVGFVAFADGTPSTYLQFLGSSKEGFLPFSGSINDGELFEFGATLRALGITKMWRPVYFASDTTNRDHGAEGIGYVADYNGGTYANTAGAGSWLGWDTGSNTWLGHTFRIQLETGTAFVTGTLTVKGRNY